VSQARPTPRKLQETATRALGPPGCVAATHCQKACAKGLQAAKSPEEGVARRKRRWKKHRECEPAVADRGGTIALAAPPERACSSTARQRTPWGHAGRRFRLLRSLLSESG
jgi:hypothetical protein